MDYKRVRAIAFCSIVALVCSGAFAANAQETTTTPPASARTAQPQSDQSASPPAATAQESAAPADETSETTSETTGAPPAGKGLVVIFRPSRFVGAALVFTAREGEDIIGTLGGGRYLSVPADPGIHEYNIRGGETIRIEVEEGETYYLQLNIAMGLLSGRGVLAPSDRATFEAHPLQPSRDAHASAESH